MDNETLNHCIDTHQSLAHIAIRNGDLDTARYHAGILHGLALGTENRALEKQAWDFHNAICHELEELGFGA